MMKPQAKKEMVISMNEQRKNLKKYILPAMLSNVSFFILTIVDGMFVGNGVGANISFLQEKSKASLLTKKLIVKKMCQNIIGSHIVLINSLLITALHK